MQAQVYLLLLVACFATYIVADQRCPPLDDTVSYIPHPTDCSKFLACQLGNSVELTCLNNTLWNDAIKACDLQTNVMCISSTAEPTTAEVTTTTAAPSTNPSGKCPDLFDPDQQVFLPHIDCTKFYICTWGGVAIEQNCPPNLHWNQNLSYCDYPFQAGCTSVSSTTQTTLGPITSTTSVPTSNPQTTATSTEPSTALGECPSIYDPNHQVYFPHVDCTKYYICTYEGNKLEQSCPPNLHWNQLLSYCDFPAQAGCDQINPTSQITSASSAPAATTSTTAPTINCSPLDDPTNHIYFPHPTNCSMFQTCQLGSPVELSCPNGTLWNDAIKSCDQKENVVCISQPDPSTVNPTTTTIEAASTTSTTVAPSTNPSGTCPDVFDPSQQVFLPHADCTKFYICTWGGLAVEKNCPPNLHWNQNLSYCDYPAQAGCSSASPTPQPTSEPTAPTTVPTSPTTASDECPAVYDPNHQVYFPHVDCSKYYICTYEGNKLEQNCPVGLHWSQALSYCERPELVQCVSL